MHERSNSTPAAIALLVQQLVEGSAVQSVGADLESWIVDSRRFRAFVEMHRDKIRKKLRGASDPDAGLDVRAELCVAYRLLRDRRVELDFEAYGSGNAGPDFTVTFRGSRRLNVEVTRLRQPPNATALSGTLLTKLRQLPPGIPNVVVICAPGQRCDRAATDEAVRALRARADAKDETYFASRGLTDSRRFYQRFQRLCGVVTWCEEGEGDDCTTVWDNRSARIGLPEPAFRACVVALRGS